jgi:hypothetical protein
VFGRIRFDLLGAGGDNLGQIRAENWRAWDFSIVDRNETEIGRIDKKFVGVAKAVFTNADNYVVSLDTQLAGDLRLLVVAAAAAVDTPSSRTRAVSTSPTSWTSPDLAGAESVIRERVAVAVIACRVDPGTSPCGQSVRQSVWGSC